MLPTTFGSESMTSEERQQAIQKNCFHRLPGGRSAATLGHDHPHSTENSTSTTNVVPEDDEVNNDEDDDSVYGAVRGTSTSASKRQHRQFIPAPKALVQALLGKKTHQSRCVLLACSYCGRWATERFYTKEEARLVLLSASPAVHCVQSLACNSAYGQELLDASNLHSVLTSGRRLVANNSTTTTGLSSSGSNSGNPMQQAPLPPPLLEELLRRRSQINIPPTLDGKAPSTLTPTLRRYLVNHIKDVMEIKILLEANGLSLPADTQEGFLLDNFLVSNSNNTTPISQREAVTITPKDGGDATAVAAVSNHKNNNNSLPAADTITGDTTGRRGRSGNDTRLRYDTQAPRISDPTLLTPSQKMRLAIHPELAWESDATEESLPVKTRSGNEALGVESRFDYSQKGLTLFIRNPDTFKCNWQDCQEERRGLRPSSFLSERRDPLAVHTWPSVNACLCTRCGKLRLSSRFYPGCPMSFTCHLAAVPSERECDVPESPLLSGNGSAVMSTSSSSRRRGPVTLQEIPGRVKCGQLVSEEDPLIANKIVHTHASDAFEAHAAKLRAEKALADAEDNINAGDSNRKKGTRRKKTTPLDPSNINAGVTTSRASTREHSNSTNNGEDVVFATSTSLLSGINHSSSAQLNGSISTVPMVASTRTLRSVSADSLPPNNDQHHPLAPPSIKTNNNTNVVVGGKRSRPSTTSTKATAPSSQLAVAEIDDGGDSPSAAATKESWVACDNCKKWRIVSREVMVHVETTGDNWYCWENVPPRRCAEAEDEAK